MRVLVVPELYRPDDATANGTLNDAVVWVENWDEAVDESKRMLEYAKEIRDPERSGQRTYDDMAERVVSNVEAYASNLNDGSDRNDEVVGEALGEVGDEFALDELNRKTAEFTETGEPILAGKCALSEVLFALRRRGDEDIGNPGTPVFEKREEVSVRPTRRRASAPSRPDADAGRVPGPERGRRRGGASAATRRPRSRVRLSRPRPRTRRVRPVRAR